MTFSTFKREMLTAVTAFVICLTAVTGHAQKLAVLKYKGGGDWYSNPTALPNLIKYCNANIGTAIDERIENVEVGSSDIFQYPLLHMTGHGNVFFSEDDAENLRNYLTSRGLLTY